MEKEARGRRGAHGMRHFEEAAKQKLCKFVGFGIRNNKKDEGRNKGIFRLQQNI